MERLSAKKASNDLQRKALSNVILISSNFHAEPFRSKIGETLVPGNNLLMQASFLVDGKHFIMGDPGSGKTSNAQLFSCINTGLPYDLVAIAGFNGQQDAIPGNTIYTSEWTGKSVKIIFEARTLMPVIIIDEANRYSSEMQTAFLKFLEEGKWVVQRNYHRAVTPAYLTANYTDDGTVELIPPFKNRMDIATCEEYPGMIVDYVKMKDNRKNLLESPGRTDEILGGYAERGDREKFLSALGKLCAERAKSLRLPVEGAGAFTPDEKARALEQIRSVKLVQGDLEGNRSYYLMNSYMAEINECAKYGAKRSQDGISEDPRDQKRLGVNVINPYSARLNIATEIYSKAVAWMLGAERVAKEHLMFVLPHVIALKLRFAPQFITQHGSEERTQPREMHFAKELALLGLGNYEREEGEIRKVVAEVQELREQKNWGGITALKPEKYENPLSKALVREAVECAYRETSETGD